MTHALGAGAIAALDHLEAEGPRLMAELRRNAAHFRRLAAASLPGLQVVGGAGAGGEEGAGAGGEEAQAVSPVIHLALDPSPPREKVGRPWLLSPCPAYPLIPFLRPPLLMPPLALLQQPTSVKWALAEHVLADS
jgi:hypothetical protein